MNALFIDTLRWQFRLNKEDKPSQFIANMALLMQSQSPSTRVMMKTDKKLEIELGKLFRSERMKVGLSQGKVCRALGYSTPQYLSNFERGLCSMPLDKLKRMIDMYKMDGDEVVDLIIDLQEKFLRSQFSSKGRKAQRMRN